MFFFLIIKSFLFFLILGLPILLAIAFYTWAERKILASIQRRVGPNVVGFFGILQPFADGLKLLNKQFIWPKGSNKILFVTIPIFFFTLSFIPWVFLPFTQFDIFINTNLSLLYILATSSLSVYGIIFGGWASNSRYSFLGALRSSAQMISYEISLSIIFISICLCANSLNLFKIMHLQQQQYYSENSLYKRSGDYYDLFYNNWSITIDFKALDKLSLETPCESGECVITREMQNSSEQLLNAEIQQANLLNLYNNKELVNQVKTKWRENQKSIVENPFFNKKISKLTFLDNIFYNFFLKFDKEIWTNLPFYIIENSVDHPYYLLWELDQRVIWYIFPLWPLFIMCFISFLAETNRTPFDLPEAEAELVAGYNVEYSSMSFSFFFLGEYANMLFTSFLLTCLFFGGTESFFFIFYILDGEFLNFMYAFKNNYYLPIIISIFKIIPNEFAYIIKALFFMFCFIWIRATLPRYRYNQLMEIGWKNFLPFSLSYLIFLISFMYIFSIIIILYVHTFDNNFILIDTFNIYRKFSYSFIELDFWVLDINNKKCY